MRIVWNEQSVQWFRDASEYTGYNRELAKILLKYIPLRTTLCDVGCGAGLIDFELAPFFHEITCVDIASPAIASIQDYALAHKISNVLPVCKDAEQMTGQWDTVIALFHGGPVCLTKYFPMAWDRLILATYLERKGEFGPKNKKVPKRFDVAEARMLLDGLGVNYTMETHSLEYGQPFRAYRDAACFVQAYSQPMTKEEMKEYLRDHLQETGREDFPYYLPKKKNFGLFVIRRDENENMLEKLQSGEI